jgi:hypothetical protein
MEQAMMGAVGMIAGPSSPFPMNQPFMQMQEQYNLNRAMEQNFTFVRPGGRGFTPMQQLAVGQGFRGIAAGTPGLEMPELQGLMQQGAQLGQYQGVKDVTSMIKRTKDLLQGWRDIAIELGTTMQEAQRIQAQVRQTGVFGAGQQTQAIQGMATMAAISGIGVQQQMAMGGAAAQAAPRLYGQGFGGVRRAAAEAGMAQLTGLSMAARQGFVSEEAIFEATGQYGAEGRMAFAQRMSQAGSKFMRRGRGKITLAAFVDPSTMQIDEDALQDFMGGGMTTGEVERRAKQNISKMGQVDWRTNRARLSAEFSRETKGLGEMALIRNWMNTAHPGLMENDPDKAKLAIARMTPYTMSEVEALMPMLENLPLMEVRAQNEERMVQEQRDQAKQWAQHSPQAQQQRVKDKMKEAMTRPLSKLQNALMEGMYGAAEDMMMEESKQFEAYIGKASRDTVADITRGGAAGTQARAFHEQMMAPVGPGAMRGMEKGMAATQARNLGRMGRGERLLEATADLLRGTGRAFTQMMGVGPEMPATPLDVSNQDIAAALNAGSINWAQAGFKDAGAFNRAYTDQNLQSKISVAMAAGGPEAALSIIKDSGYAENDLQAQAILSKIKNNKGAAGVEFKGPAERSTKTSEDLRKISSKYIEEIQATKGTGSVDLGGGGMDVTAREWLNNPELVKAVMNSEYNAEDMQKLIGMASEISPEAGEFLYRAGFTEDKFKRLKTAMKAEYQASNIDLVKEMYGAQISQAQTTKAKGALEGLPKPLQNYLEALTGEFSPGKAHDLNVAMLNRKPEDILKMADQAEASGNEVVANQLRASANIAKKYTGKTSQETRMKIMNQTLFEDHKASFQRAGITQKQISKALKRGPKALDKLLQGLSDEDWMAVSADVSRTRDMGEAELTEMAAELTAAETERGLAGQHAAKQRAEEERNRKSAAEEAQIKTAVNTEIIANALGKGVLNVRVAGDEGDNEDEGEGGKKGGKKK